MHVVVSSDENPSRIANPNSHGLEAKAEGAHVFRSCGRDAKHEDGFGRCNAHEQVAPRIECQALRFVVDPVLLPIDYGKRLEGVLLKNLTNSFVME